MRLQALLQQKPFFALAQAHGWQTVYGIAALAICVPMLVMVFLAKEPPDRDAHSSLREHVACLFEQDGWAFSLKIGRAHV